MDTPVISDSLADISSNPGSILTIRRRSPTPWPLLALDSLRLFLKKIVFYVGLADFSGLVQ
jgi:hypothetical protein